LRDLEHIGSTSVPGLAAKPVIDIDLTVADSSDEAAYVPDLEAAGFRFVLCESDWHEHRLLTCDDPRTNLHVFPPDRPEVIRPRMFRDWLVENGVPADAVVRDFAGRDTYDSCVRARRIFGVDRALVVSQGYHLPRAVTTCRAVGLDAEGVGDWTARTYASVWAAGERREKLAASKAVIDVVSGRDPVLGPAKTSVRDALAAAIPTN